MSWMTCDVCKGQAYRPTGDTTCPYCPEQSPQVDWRARAEAAEAELIQATRMLDAQTEGAQAGDAGLGPEANPYPIDEPGTIGPATMWEVARMVAANHRHTEAALAELRAAGASLRTAYESEHTRSLWSAAAELIALLPPEGGGG